MRSPVSNFAFFPMLLFPRSPTRAVFDFTAARIHDEAAHVDPPRRRLEGAGLFDWHRGSQNPTSELRGLAATRPAVLGARA